MGFFKHILLVAKITGVAHYIFVDSKGIVIAHNLKDYKTIGTMVSFCGQQAFSIGKDSLSYLTFTRKCQEDLFIFPVGNYYLGVIKQKDVKTVDLTNEVLDFLSDLDV